LVSNIRTNIGMVTKRWNLFKLFSSEIHDSDFWDSLEETLISGDVGVDLTGEIIRDLREKSGSFRSMDQGKGLALLAGILSSHLSAVKGTGEPVRFGESPTAVMLLGVNGSGKTTTAAKMAWNLQKEGKKVILAAADTYRAAATDQLKTWGELSGTRVVAHATGGDPGAVVFDAIRAAKAGGHDCLIIDTAGRLHTRSNLMEELKKMMRIIEGNCAEWIVESLLVIDAVTGQNGFRQAEAFGNTISLTGAVITKYDHTAKGGIILSVGRELGLPVRYVGLGEGIEDLRLFEPEAFVEALLGINSGVA